MALSNCLLVVLKTPGLRRMLLSIRSLFSFFTAPRYSAWGRDGLPYNTSTNHVAPGRTPPGRPLNHTLPSAFLLLAMLLIYWDASWKAPGIPSTSRLCYQLWGRVVNFIHSEGKENTDALIISVVHYDTLVMPTLMIPISEGGLIVRVGN